MSKSSPPRAPRLLAGGLLLASLASCARREELSAVAELERLAFVPPGECRLEDRYGLALACANERPLLVDRFEVSARAWREAHAEPAAEEALPASWAPAKDAWPATYLTLEEARAFAASRGMRLPTAREWLRIACGTRRLPWPWGSVPASSVANTLELGLRHPLPVGTFEQGRTPFATYDMLGNAWEWVEEPVALTGSAHAPGLAWAMGGSYLSRLRRIHELDGGGRLVLHVQELDPRTRSIDVGLRCVVDAETWLRARADGWGRGEDARARVAGVGASWGRDAVPLLETLVAREGAAPALAWLLEGARR